MMKWIRLLLVCLLLTPADGEAQRLARLASLKEIPVPPEEIHYGVETAGFAATGDYTPFWAASNRYGTVPLAAVNGYLRADVTHSRQITDDFRWTVGLDVLCAAPRYRNMYVQQFYTEAQYKQLTASIGSKEQYISLWDRRLSSGDMIQSANARPVPEINISVPQFIVVPFTEGLLQAKGDVSFGLSLDTKYLEDFAREGEAYVKNVRRHHKSLFLRVRDMQGGFPFYGTLGLQHTAQWGGTSTDPKTDRQPGAFTDFIRMFFARHGGADANLSDQINVLGAHHVSYDMQIGYRREDADWEVQAYYQHLSYDASGLSFYNGADGLWGIRLDLFRFPWLSKVVAEYVNTRNQSGSFHHILFNHDKHPGMGGGGDDYYNNGIYTNGHTYFNRGVGSPLLPSPEYNANGTMGYSGTRILDWHIGLEGALTPQASYRILYTLMNGWGTSLRPFLRKKAGTSFLIEIAYTHPDLAGWTFTGSLAGDTSDVFGSGGGGVGIGISKRGVASWR
ncbi:hypothetical protein Barb6XT_00898 [Bacteroidales bacterium Barb6XT]|nr:hypothetical protein Barb6XT_00898 [Bacteroidales bacterium Barb6XT]